MLVEDLSRVIGLEAAIRLAVVFSGEKLYIPHKFDASHEIADILGLPLANKLAKHYQGTSLNFPSFRRRGRGLDHRLIEFQTEKIEEAKSLGFSRRDCSKIFGITDRMLRYRA